MLGQSEKVSKAQVDEWFRQGYQAWEKGDYKEAVKLYQLAADQGCAGAQVNLGCMYRDGEGVKKDEAEAVRLYQLAADQGYAWAQSNLGRMYANGQGVKKDEAEAVRLYQLAADQGYAWAQYGLGNMYVNGRGVKKDEAMAVKWYRKAAEQKFAAAQVNLGMMYQNGQGVPKDEKKAVEWYTKAAEQKYAAAQANLGELYLTGLEVLDYQQAHVWSEKTYNNEGYQGRKAAGGHLGLLYAYGLGQERSMGKALKYYTEAAEDGYPLAQILLGVSHAIGETGVVDEGKIEKWFLMAAEPGAAYKGWIYDDLIGFFERLADKGEVSSSLILAIVHERGLLRVNKDEKEAVKWYLKAAERGNAWAQVNLGVMYANGRGVPKDEAMAVKWYQLAADQGDADAQSRLDELKKRAPPAALPLSVEAVEALYDFDSKESSELSMRTGEVLEVINKDDKGWWMCRNSSGKTGIVPSNYLKACVSNTLSLATLGNGVGAGDEEGEKSTPRPLASPAKTAGVPQPQGYKGTPKSPTAKGEPPLQQKQGGMRDNTKPGAGITNAAGGNHKQEGSGM